MYKITEQTNIWLVLVILPGPVVYIDEAPSFFFYVVFEDLSIL